MAWRRGAAGERRTARLLSPLEGHGWAVLHDLAVPRSQANLDCDDPERGGRGEV
ncbi:MAG: nuclease-related domain-containing protein [Gemmatimonadales bacterium]